MRRGRAAERASLRSGQPDLATQGVSLDEAWRTAQEPGKWLLHCHINHHTTNDNVEEEGAGGLTMIIEVSP